MKRSMEYFTDNNSTLNLHFSGSSSNSISNQKIISRNNLASQSQVVKTQDIITTVTAKRILDQNPIEDDDTCEYS